MKARVRLFEYDLVEILASYVVAALARERAAQ